MLEQPLPNLCADRIDYNIQGAYFQGFLTKEEALELYENLKIVNGYWISNRIDLLRKLVKFSLFMTENCWGRARVLIVSYFPLPINHITLSTLWIHFYSIYLKLFAALKEMFVPYSFRSIR